jgi:hypothetical protein
MRRRMPCTSTSKSASSSGYCGFSSTHSGPCDAGRKLFPGYRTEPPISTVTMSGGVTSKRAARGVKRFRDEETQCLCECMWMSVSVLRCASVCAHPGPSRRTTRPWSTLGATGGCCTWTRMMPPGSRRRQSHWARHKQRWSLRPIGLLARRDCPHDTQDWPRFQP